MSDDIKERSKFNPVGVKTRLDKLRELELGKGPIKMTSFATRIYLDKGVAERLIMYCLDTFGPISRMRNRVINDAVDRFLTAHGYTEEPEE